MKRLLPRLLSRWGVASRREAEQLVHDGRVRVDGRVVRDVLREVDEDRARVEVDGARVGPSRGAVWLAVNKPRGVVTTTRDPEGRRTVLDLVPAPHPPGLAPVGRLDMDSAGLLLLTNDHALSAALLDPATHVDKRYRVKIRGRPSDEALTRLRTETVEDEGLVLGPMDVVVAREAPRSTWLDVTLREGKNRQIRRRLAREGHDVEVLVRVAFGPIALGDLVAGAWRPLTAAEVAALRGVAGG